MDILDTFFNWTVFRDSLPLLLLGLTTTLSLGVTSILIGLVTGLFLALIRMYAPAPPQRWRSPISTCSAPSRSWCCWS